MILSLPDYLYGLLYLSNPAFLDDGETFVVPHWVKWLNLGKLTPQQHGTVVLPATLETLALEYFYDSDSITNGKVVFDGSLLQGKPVLVYTNAGMKEVCITTS